MNELTLIRYEGNPVGVVADGEVRLNEHLVDPEALPTVCGMALFALEVQAGNIDGPYTESRALAYANEANRQRALAATPRLGRG